MKIRYRNKCSFIKKVNTDFKLLFEVNSLVEILVSQTELLLRPNLHSKREKFQYLVFKYTYLNGT